MRRLDRRNRLSKTVKSVLNNRLSKVILGAGRNGNFAADALPFPFDPSGGSYETPLDFDFNDVDSGIDFFLYPRLGLSIDRPAAALICSRAQFVTDVTVPDGTIIAPGTTFTKTWRLKNIGNCTWTTSYALVFTSGNAMGAPQSAAVNFPSNVAPGQTVDLSVQFTAPTTAGAIYRLLETARRSGNVFGIGWNANRSFWVEINVSTTSRMWL